MPHTDAVRHELYLLSKTGEMDAKSKLIISMMPDIQIIAKSCLKMKSKINYEDLEAEALYLLTMAVEASLKIDVNDGISKYLTTYVIHNLRKFIFTYQKKKIPASWKIKKEIPTTNIINTYRGQIVHGELTAGHKGFFDSIDEKDLYRRELDLLIEVLETCIHTSLELKIYKMSAFGLSNDEIAQQIELPAYRIILIKRGLRHRFQERLMEIENV